MNSMGNSASIKAKKLFNKVYKRCLSIKGNKDRLTNLQLSEIASTFGGIYWESGGGIFVTVIPVQANGPHTEAISIATSSIAINVVKAPKKDIADVFWEGNENPAMLVEF